MGIDNNIINDESTFKYLEELLDYIPYEVWIKDEYGRHMYINKVSAEKMGYNKEELIGKTDYDFRPKIMAEKCVLSDKRLLKCDTGIFIEEKSYLNGDKQWYDICKVKLPGKDKLIGGIAKEVTVNKTLQNGVIASSLINNKDDYNLKEEILKQLKIKLEAEDIAVYTYEIESNTMKLSLQLNQLNFNNNKLWLKEQYTLDEKLNPMFLHKKIISEIKYFNDDKYKIKIYPILNGGKLKGALHIIIKDLDKSKYVQDDLIFSSCISLGVIIENDELSRKLTKELKSREKAQNNLKLILETSIDIYAIISLKDNKFEWVEISDKFESILGWNIVDLNSRKVTNLIHPEYKIDLLRAIITSYANSMYKGFVCRTLCKDGSYKFMEWNWNCLKEDSKLILTARDMSSIANLLEQKKNLESAIELEGLKNEFFANISHEFKTPLNIIISAVQLINDYLDNNLNIKKSKIKRYIKGIKQNSFRLLKLANNLIDITKIDDGNYALELDNYNIVDIIENIVLSVADYIQNNKRNITFDTCEEEIILACDPEKIERIILNLLSNAIKFTQQGGNIYINLNINEECSKVIIKVRNDGESISKSDSEKIFKRFTQAESLFTRGNEGTGIGLSLVKSLVEMHKGKIYANIEVKKGTEFVIELPIVKIKNNNSSHILDRKLNSEVQKYDIEFSDIYN